MSRGARSSGALAWVAALGVAIAAGSVASCSGEEGPRPRLEVTPSPIEIGEVAWQTQVEKDFVLRNVSDRDVTLKEWKFDCKCFTILKPPASLVRPGERLTLRLVMASGQTDPRPFRKKLTIVSDDPLQPHLEVPIVGEVVQYALVTPAVVEFGPVVPAPDLPARTIQARPGPGMVLTLQRADSTDPRLAVSSEAKDGGAEVHVALEPDAQTGFLRAQVRLVYRVTGRGKEPYEATTLIPVSGEIQAKP